ncbi:uncharacterized protein HD556DRAFT_1456348 [Suillus plorans]|uniref:non-chaperonin molecular chaperone ATPase n=1 Tax=Suillus plorans TaxID=116603 RepID=A0A9P7AB76_9AGAM|nr:uncharacterized protein HD556DRAFT_1456348 [Suillus plorans]KAG1785797.1 hypothetical protein HD556DRAFT_1456348 [Suillus plorans]
MICEASPVQELQDGELILDRTRKLAVPRRHMKEAIIPALSSHLGDFYPIVVCYNGKTLSAGLVQCVSTGLPNVSGTSPTLLNRSSSCYFTIPMGIPYWAHPLVPLSSPLSTRRLIGRKMDDLELKRDMKHFPFNIVDKGGQPAILIDISFAVEELLITIVNETAAKVVPEVLGVPRDIIFSIINMGRKRSKLSTVGKVKEAIVQSTGDLRTLRSNLTKLRADRIAFEREQVQSQLEANITARQLLAEAALEVGTANDASTDAQYPDHPDIDFDMGEDEDYVDEEDGLQEEEDESVSGGNNMGGYEGSAVDVARARIVYSLQGRYRHRRPLRSRLQRNRHCHSAWMSQMPALVAGYLRWKHHAATPTPTPNVEVGTFMFHVSTVDILASVSSISVLQAADELANVSLINMGLLGCSPIQPKIAVSLQCLELYHQIRRRKPSFSVQAMVKVLCALHNRSYFQALRDQFAIAFDAYLNILRRVRELANTALKRDTPHWRMLHSCPACNYKQENEPTLIPARMDSMDGNNSLKWVDGSGHADERIFESSYLIPPDEVDVFKDDTLVEMRRSGELAKYALATTNKVLDVYGLNGVTGYDIGCSYQKTVDASSISIKAHSNHHRFIVNSFHGHAHNRRCQLRFHPLYQHGLGLEDLETCERIFSASNAVAPIIRHASYFHWLQFIDLHFQQWDSDRYLELSMVLFKVLELVFDAPILGKFLYNNYKQALGIIDDLSPAVKELKLALNISDGDFERWNMEELEFLETLTEETEEDIEAMTYVEALRSLAKAEAAYGSVTTVQFLTYTPADFTATHGLQKKKQVLASAREAERHAAHRKLILEMNVVDDIERRMGIAERWQPQDTKYQEGLVYLTNRQFIRAIEQLQGLVVQRLFELAKANIAGTGYKLRQHISNTISRRSGAIRRALEKYNQLAIVQTPPRDVIEYSEVASYAWLGEFDLLKHSRHRILEKPWTSKGNREVANNFFKIQRAHEEVRRLNVEVARLSAWVDYEDAHLKSTFESLVESDPTLSHEISCMYKERKRANDVHRRRIQAIYDLSGYCGSRGTETRGIDDHRGGDADEMMEDLRGTRSIEADEDDALWDEADRLEACMI